jgi:hypothetical protein
VLTPTKGGNLHPDNLTCKQLIGTLRAHGAREITLLKTPGRRSTASACALSEPRHRQSGTRPDHHRTTNPLRKLSAGKEPDQLDVDLGLGTATDGYSHVRVQPRTKSLRRGWPPPQRR